MKKRLSLLLMLVTIFMVSCQSNEKKDDYVSKRGTETAAETAAETSKETVKEEISKVRMKFLGDIFPHWKQVWYAQARGESGKYDFQDNFALIKDYTSDADITIVNNELSTNPKRKVSTYPIFNIPEGIYDTYKTMGVDIVNTANNHSVDGGFEGIDTTIDAIHKRGLENFGTQKDESTPYLIKEVNGIKIGFLSYTYGLNGFEQSMDTPEEKAKITLLSNEEKIKSDIEKVKELSLIHI